MPLSKKSKTWYVLAVGLQLGLTIAVPVVVFVFAGFWMDETLHTAPFWSIVGVLVGIVVSISSVYYLLKPLISGEDSPKNDQLL